MPAFRWSYLAHDVALATEVVFVRPFNATEWDQIAKKLNSAFSTQQRVVEIKGSGCRERMELLSQKYRVKDAKALKRLDFFNFSKSKLMQFPMLHVAHVFVCICAYLCLLAPLHTVMYRSHNEEEYSALQQLLEDIISCNKNFSYAKEVKEEMNKKKDKEDKNKGEEMRTAAMEGQTSMYISCLLFLKLYNFVKIALLCFMIILKGKRI